MTDYAIKIGYQVDASGLKAARAEIGKINRDLDKSKRLSENFGKNLVRGAAVGAAALTALGIALNNITKETLKAIQALNDAAFFTGSSATEISKLVGAFKIAGVEVNNIADVINRVNERVKQAVSGSKEFKELFLSIGLSAKDLEKQDPTEVLKRIIVAINQTSDASLRARAINQLLGRSNLDLLKIGVRLNEIRALEKKAIEEGIAPSEKLIELGKQFDEATNNLQTQITRVKNAIVEVFGQTAIDSVSGFADAIDENFGTIVKTLETVNETLTNIVNSIKFLSEAGKTSTGELNLGFALSPILNQLGIIPDFNFNDFRIAFDKAYIEVAKRYVETSKKVLDFIDNIPVIGQIDDVFFPFLFKAAREKIKEVEELVPVVEKRVEKREENREKRIEEEAKRQEQRKNKSKSSSTNSSSTDSNFEFLSLKNDAAAENLLEIIKEQERFERERLEAREKFFEKIEEEINLQKAAFEEVDSGRIRSQQELNRFLEEERELQQLILSAKAEGVSLTKEEAEEILKRRRELERETNERLRKIEEFDKFIKSITEGIGDRLADSIIEGLEAGKFEFENFLQDISRLLISSGIRELIAALFRPQGENGQSIVGAVISSIIGFFVGGRTPASDGGGAAFGAVVNTPQTYGGKFMAEQGPEAIMPLGRDSSGRLGVRIADKGSNATVINFTNNITVNGSDNPQETAEKTARALEQLVDRKIKAQLVNQQRAGNLLNAMPRGF